MSERYQEEEQRQVMRDARVRENYQQVLDEVADLREALAAANERHDGAEAEVRQLREQVYALEHGKYGTLHLARMLAHRDGEIERLRDELRRTKEGR